VQEEAK
jgi:hypothetical protein